MHYVLWPQKYKCDVITAQQSQTITDHTDHTKTTYHPYSHVHNGHTRGDIGDINSRSLLQGRAVTGNYCTMQDTCIESLHLILGQRSE